MSSIRWWTEVFKKQGVCLQAFPSLPSPTLSFLFLLLPHFLRGKMPKTPFFTLCSTETLATQANVHFNSMHSENASWVGGWVGHVRQWRMAKEKLNLAQATWPETPHTLVFRLTAVGEKNVSTSFVPQLQKLHFSHTAGSHANLNHTTVQCKECRV